MPPQLPTDDSNVSDIGDFLNETINETLVALSPGAHRIKGPGGSNQPKSHKKIIAKKQGLGKPLARKSLLGKEGSSKPLARKTVPKTRALKGPRQITNRRRKQGSRYTTVQNFRSKY